ncbi:HNH endonuclease domain-containing protein [Hoyosella altamirensis]|uniref:HNH nuclease domain-containing protein n=1 Tax=Hoyosella altamirensis TaxID=616997 RepID=A0A839RJS6_9ACTN|nr:hypothetical protein [Hoyosella altamirensis]
MASGGSAMEFAQRLVALVETGRRQSTYKLATLMAIMDVCVENQPRPDGTLAIPVQELAHRVVAYYWPQVRPFAEYGPLRQSKSAPPVILKLVGDARDVLLGRGVRTPEAAREAEDPDYLRMVRSVELILAKYPLTHLQTPTRQLAHLRNDFIYDARAFHNNVTRRELEQHGPLVLRPGVADALRDFAPLLKPMIEMVWVGDVVDCNRQALEHDDIAGFLFGSERSHLLSLRNPLRDLQNGRCFYCDRNLPADVHIDHVLPWSKVPIDGVANLVLVDAACNLDKSAMLPVRVHVDRAVARPPGDLSSIADLTGLPVLKTRTVNAARGIYGTLPPGVPLWRAPKQYAPHGNLS